MIYINFKKGQGLGNQLWLYASALNIAKKRSDEFVKEQKYKYIPNLLDTKLLKYK